MGKLTRKIRAAIDGLIERKGAQAQFKDAGKFVKSLDEMEKSVFDIKLIKV